MGLLVRPARAAWIALPAAAVVVSVAVYVAFFVAMGDPMRMFGSAHGDWESILVYYPVVLALGACALALLSPETTILTGPLFAASQIFSGLVAGRADVMTQPLLVLLGIPLVLWAVVPWVLAGTVLGAGVRLGARAIGRRTSS